MKGFTLIELMITVIIIGILATISYPLYISFITKTYRIKAEQNLLLLSKDMEQYYAEHNNYLGATIKKIGGKTEDSHYHYQIKELTEQSYQLAAIPNTNQAQHDKICGVLTLNQLGEQSINGTGKLNDCWIN